MPSPYEKSWDWFTTTSELKPIYKHLVELDTTMKSNKESVNAFEEYPKLCDSFLAMF